MMMYDTETRSATIVIVIDVWLNRKDVYEVSSLMDCSECPGDECAGEEPCPVLFVPSFDTPKSDGVNGGTSNGVPPTPKSPNMPSIPLMPCSPPDAAPPFDWESTNDMGTLKSLTNPFAPFAPAPPSRPLPAKESCNAASMLDVVGVSFKMPPGYAAP